MLDTICLWTGRVVIFGCGAFLSLCLISGGLYLLWNEVLQYFFFKIKRLFPKWQLSQNLIDEWQDIIKNADSTDWRSEVVIEQKGRFVKLYFPSAHFGGRVEYGLIKKLK